MDGDAVCECCASMPFSHDGRNYDVVRNNNSNIRDFWVVRTDVSRSWSEALDIDPTNWSINSCPASEAETCILADGTLWRFHVGCRRRQQVYWSTADLEAWSLLDSDRIQPGVDRSKTTPPSTPMGTTASWLGRAIKEVMTFWSPLAATQREDPERGRMLHRWSQKAVRPQPPPSGAGCGQHRPPRLPAPFRRHLSLRRGTIGASSTLPPLMVNAPLEVSSTPMGWHVSGHTGFHWTVHDLSGRCMASGQSPDGNVSFGENRIYILGITSEMDVQHFKLAR